MSVWHCKFDRHIYAIYCVYRLSQVTGGIHDPNAKGGYTTPLEGASRNPSVDPRDKTRVIKRCAAP